MKIFSMRERHLGINNRKYIKINYKIDQSFDKDEEPKKSWKESS